jgi:hypothetical protein
LKPETQTLNQARESVVFLDGMVGEDDAELWTAREHFPEVRREGQGAGY